MRQGLEPAAAPVRLHARGLGARAALGRALTTLGHAIGSVFDVLVTYVFAPLGPPATEEWAPPAEPSEAEQRMLLERFPPELDSETEMLETRIAEAENALEVMRTEQKVLELRRQRRAVRQQLRQRLCRRLRSQRALRRCLTRARVGPQRYASRCWRPW